MTGDVCRHGCDSKRAQGSTPKPEARVSIWLDGIPTAQFSGPIGYWRISSPEIPCESSSTVAARPRRPLPGALVAGGTRMI